MTPTIEQQIMQAEAALAYKETLYKHKRCKQTDIDMAMDTLNSLRIEQQNMPESVIEKPVKVYPKYDRLSSTLLRGWGVIDYENQPIIRTPVQKVVKKPLVQKVENNVSAIIEKAQNYDELQANLTAEAKKLKDKQAEISNEIVERYKSGATNTGGLMSQAIDFKNQIESIWDKKKFLEKNGSLPNMEIDSEEVIVNQEVLEKRMAWQYERKLVKDSIYKLGKKMKDPTKHVSFHKVDIKMLDWRKEMLILEAKLADLTLKIDVSI